LIEFTCATDDQFFSQPFRVEKESFVQVYALGEAYHRGVVLADYAWIEEAPSGELFWMMDLENSDHAGGAKKNRVVDSEMRLPPGEYVACYMTDDSHAWDSWNASPPFDPSSWGLTLWPGKGFRSGDIQLLDASELQEDSRVLVKLTKVRDDQHLRQRFRLDRPTRVSVYALGEGDHGEMWDAGWIMDLDRKKTVWRMVWRETEGAGGHKKNRFYRGTMKLRPGRYEAHYETDDSHSFGSWNVIPPCQPHLWGLTITRAD
jgi:hypothetical protein